ncbi:MAG: PQQ-binding-like beta-propeller repeat protein [Granulicella sp.]
MGQRQAWSEAVDSSGDNSHYVPLKEITKANVKDLKQIWSYPTGDSTAYTFAPLVANNRIYVLAHNNSLVALDAKTGKEVWIHAKLGGIANRGIAYWQSADAKQHRLIFTIHQQLQEIDADTGKSILSFGNNGFIDLRVGLNRPLTDIFRIQTSSRPQVYGNIVVVGSATGENYMATPGDIRGFDVLTGKLAWQFHTIPHPGEVGYDTWPKDAYKFIGGANTWGDIAIDQKHGIAFFPTSSAKYELYGGDRPGNNLFTDCLIALDAKTGKLLWYYQMIHHDIWDWDNVAAPQLATVKHNGKSLEIVAQAGKTGFLYVFDRITGKPLWPIEERPVPQTDFPGEWTAATQPFPTVVPPFARQTFTADDVDPYILSPDERDALKKQVAAAKNGPLFTPPGWGDTIQMPGNRGGANWGSTSANPSKGYVYVAAYNSPAILHMTDEAPGAPKVVASTSGSGTSGLELYSQNCAVCHGASRTGELGPSLIDISDRRTLDSIKSLIQNGQGQMPAFGNLSDDKVSAIAQYIFSPKLEINPMSGAGFRRQAAPGNEQITGPVVASGGAPAGEAAPSAKLGQSPYGGMAGLPYPAGVKEIKRYYTNWNVFPTFGRPPWTSLVAYDLNKGTIRWSVPLGDDPELSPKGILNTGIRQEQRGILPTATGIDFVATSDGKLRAFDDDNGKQIWSADLPAGNRAIPAMYQVDGHQYLVISATTRPGTGVGAGAGNGKPMALPPIDPNAPPPAYVVFALPKK